MKFEDLGFLEIGIWNFVYFLVFLAGTVISRISMIDLFGEIGIEDIINWDKVDSDKIDKMILLICKEGVL